MNELKTTMNPLDQTVLLMKPVPYKLSVWVINDYTEDDVVVINGNMFCSL